MLVNAKVHCKFFLDKTSYYPIIFSEVSFDLVVCGVRTLKYKKIISSSFCMDENLFQSTRY